MFHVILIILLFLSSCADKNFLRHGKDYKTSLKKQHEIFIYPTNAIVNTVDIFDNYERMYNYEEYIETISGEIITKALKKRGYKAKNISKKDLKKLNIYKEFFSVRNRTKEELEIIYQDNINSFDIQTDIGIKSKILAKKSRNNIAIISFFTEFVQKNDAQIRDIAISIFADSFGGSYAPLSEQAILQLAIIDLEKSKILWTYHVGEPKTAYGSILDSKENDKDIIQKKIKKMIARILKKLN